jgi:hypothetical protein
MDIQSLLATFRVIDCRLIIVAVVGPSIPAAQKSLLFA